MSAAIVGAFSELRVLHQPEIDVFIRMLSNGEHQIFAFLDAVVLVHRAEAFVLVEGVTA